MKMQLEMETGVGKKIRKLRKEKRMTLVELSNLTGVAQASLSRIETGIMKGTVESHQKIAEALGINISGLYSGVDSKQAAVDHKKDTDIQKNAHIKGNSTRVELLISQIEKRKFAPVLYTIPSGETLNFEKADRETDKFFWVQTGSFLLTLDNKDFHLNTNDTIYFAASFSHDVKNTSSQDGKIFAVSSPANF